MHPPSHLLGAVGSADRGRKGAGLRGRARGRRRLGSRCQAPIPTPTPRLSAVDSNAKILRGLAECLGGSSGRTGGFAPLRLHWRGKRSVSSVGNLPWLLAEARSAGRRERTGTPALTFSIFSKMTPPHAPNLQSQNYKLQARQRLSSRFDMTLTKHNPLLSHPHS